MKIDLKVIDSRVAELKRATPGSAAVDLRACSVSMDGTAFLQMQDGDGFVLAPGGRIKIGTGIAIDLGSLTIEGDELPAYGLNDSMMESCFGYNSYAALVLPRSGLGSNGLVLGNLVGLIDGDYQGEIVLSVWNSGALSFDIKALDRLAQLAIVPVVLPSFDVVSEFSRRTARGEGGFGSTGRT